MPPLRPKICLLRLVSAACLLLVVAVPVGAEEPGPLEPADTSSPRATLESFLDGCNEIYNYILTGGVRQRGQFDAKRQAMLGRVLNCLDLREQPEFRREQAARETIVCLKEVLDRIDLPEWDEIPAAPDHDEEDDEPPLTRWTIPNTPITIVRIADGPRTGEYLFSADTVSRAPDFYQRVAELPYKTLPYKSSVGFLRWYLSEPGWMVKPVVSALPRWTRDRYGGQALWQWAALAATIIAASVVMFLAYRVGHSRALAMREKSVFRYWVTLLFPIAAMLVPLVTRDFFSEQLRITGLLLAVLQFAANLIFLIAALVVLAAAGNRTAEAIIASPRIHPRGLDAQFIRITCRVLSITAAVIIFLEVGKYLGIPITTLLAGAGVGGLTVALAAQDTLKNLFGSMMIILDRPFRVGERIAVKDYDGVVEEIGLRSTRIRLLTGHVASIPNEEMARSDIENIGRRPHIRRVADIRIPLDTPADQAVRAVEIIREIFADHEGQAADFPPRVYLNEFNPDSLNIRLIYWYHPPNYWDFLAFSQRVNLEIKSRLTAAGIPFALPATRTVLTSTESAVLKSAAGDETQQPP